MSDRLTALRLVIDELGLPLSIDTVDDRLILQKAIYLAQSKLRLGYSYGWYVKGPYSPKLTQDYYELADEVRLDEPLEIQLRDDARQALAPVRELIEAAPEDIRKSSWLELLASMHFLVRRSGFDEAGAKQKIAETKPHLIPYIDEGVRALQL